MRGNITGNPVKGEETLLEDKHVLRKLEGQETEGTPGNQLLRQVSQLWFTIQVTNHLAKCSTSSNFMFQTYFLIKKRRFVILVRKSVLQKTAPSKTILYFETSKLENYTITIVTYPLLRSLNLCFFS